MRSLGVIGISSVTAIAGSNWNRPVERQKSRFQILTEQWMTPSYARFTALDCRAGSLKEGNKKEENAGIPAFFVSVVKTRLIFSWAVR